MSAVRLFRGQRRVDVLDPADRGLAYGDGLFETMRVHRGGVAWWGRHRDRLSTDAARLGLPPPDAGFLAEQVGQMAAALGEGVLKLVLTRGAGARGYLPPGDAEPTLVLSAHALSAPASGGLSVHCCELVLGAQPRLAGIKHLNRLEQVLARVEAQAAGADEGLLCDARGRVVCATSGNVAACVDGRWLTPPILDCGVAGICRGWLIEQGLVLEKSLDPQQLAAADAVFLCSAVRGILPVARLGHRVFNPGPAVDPLVARLGAAHPGLAAPSVEP